MTTNPATNPTPLEEMNTLASEIASTNRALKALASEYDKALAELYETYTAPVREKAREREALLKKLEKLVLKRPEIFSSPRSRTVEGVRFGLAKGRGKVVLPIDEARLIREIKRKFPDLADTLIKVTEKPVKDALAQNLTPRDLKALGVEITDAQDEAYVKLTDTEAERIIKAALEAAGKGKK